MSGGSQSAALDAVHAARPLVARLSSAMDKEDLAADIIEAWGAVEAALRSLIGGSALSGQTLIRELRQRHFLSLDQANALAEFHAARERAGRADYTPTEGDINAARAAFLKLESGLMGEADVPRAPTPARGSAAAIEDAPTVVIPGVNAAAGTPTNDPGFVNGRKGRPAWLVPVLSVVVLLVVVSTAWYLLARRGSSSAAFDQGVVAYREGRSEAAEGAFHKAAQDTPDDPLPHVYLARIERERGNLNNANAEAVKGVQLGPGSGVALRELASVLFAQQNFDGARTFYTRAVAADSTDRLARGFLGCTLIRLGRVPEGQRWLDRAGSGSWSNCAPPIGAPLPTMPAVRSP